MKNNTPITLTIAGNDASGGAGIAADLKTFTEYGTYGISALTTIATMDPKNNWKHGVTAIEASVVRDQLETATAGPEIAALKTGMLPNVSVIKVIAESIKKNNLKNIVIDPVMVCKGEDEVLNPENAEALRDILTPLATVVTPNLFEAGQLSGLGTLKDLEDMKKAAEIIHSSGAKYVVVKGGRALEGDQAIDLFYDGNEFTVLETEKVAPAFNHGAGCTFAAAITSGLAHGMEPKQAVMRAKDFVTSAIQHGFEYNQWIGPVFHSAHRVKNNQNILED